MAAHKCDHQAQLVRILRDAGRHRAPWEVFTDFVAMAALSIRNAVDRRDRAAWEAREADYMRRVGRYTKDEAMKLAQGLAHVVAGLEDGMQDFLGSLFMSLELGDAWKGQFFTPYELCLLMAKMTGHDLEGPIARRGFVRVSDPCVGGGAMVIAQAQAMRDAGINYQQHMHATAIDVDLVAVHMAYVQLSLLHVPAVVVHGNSLSLEVWSEWPTPAHILGFWDAKLRRADAEEGAAHMLERIELAEVAPAAPPAPAIAPAPVRVRPAVPQLSLF